VFGPSDLKSYNQTIIRFQPERERESKDNIEGHGQKEDLVEAKTEDNVPSEFHCLCHQFALTNLIICILEATSGEESCVCSCRP
jgi:hypothetical protein